MEFVPTGGVPPRPVVFGQYEVGRTSDPGALNYPSAAFKDGMSVSSKLETTGDPGAYDPWAHDDRRRMYGLSKNRKSFDSTAYRDLSLK